MAKILKKGGKINEKIISVLTASAGKVTLNITADERTILETADETCTKLIEKIDETVAETL